MTDYRSLEQKIRQIWIDEANRNTEIRRKVANVGRPDDNVKDETSKLAKQGEIKTKIIDEASDQQTDGAFMKDKDKGDKDTRKKPDAQDEDDPRKIKGGKTEVDLKPTTNDNTEDSTKEDDVSKKARNKVNKEIGAKGVKEETMSNKLTFGLPESLINTVRQVVEGTCPTCGKGPCQCGGDIKEELKGNQKKIDANHNGKIDAQDFKILRGKKKMEEAAKPDYLDFDKDGNKKESMKKALKDKAKMDEEVDQIDEISRATKDSYIRKADKQVTRTDLGFGKRHGGLGTKNVSPEDFKRKYENRKAGIKKANEEVEELDEVSSKTLGNYMIKATKEVSKGTDKEDKRIGGSWMADQKIRKKEGYHSNAKVAANEEVEIDEALINELSPKTLQSYNDKAIDSAFDHDAKASAHKKIAMDKRRKQSTRDAAEAESERHAKIYKKRYNGHLLAGKKLDAMGADRLPKLNREDVEIDEASYSAKSARAGKDIGKPGKNFEKIAKSAAAKYGSKEAGEKVAGAVLAKLRKEDVEFSAEELARIEEIAKGL